MRSSSDLRTSNYTDQTAGRTPSFVELGKKCMSEADSLKFTDSEQARQLYQYASAYFKNAMSEVSDPVVTMNQCIFHT